VSGPDRGGFEYKRQGGLPSLLDYFAKLSDFLFLKRCKISKFSYKNTKSVGVTLTGRRNR
jgi:hypothetical protein